MALKTTTRSSGPDHQFAAVDLRINNKVDRGYLEQTVASSKAVGRDLWKWYQNIGEVHYAISRDARIAGYAKLVCVKRAPNGEIEEYVEKGAPAEIVDQIQSPFAGSRGLIERFYTLMKVPGDSYLIQVDDGYHFCSPDELDATQGLFAGFKPGTDKVKWRTVPTLPGPDAVKGFQREIKATDFLGRVWNPSKRYVDMTDSALLAMNAECEELFILTQSIKSQLMSRFAMAGLLVLPPGIQQARVNRNQRSVTGQKLDDAIDLLIAAMGRNMREWETAAARIPIILRASHPDDGEKIKHILLDRQVYETDMQLRGELVHRILQGLDANQDTTVGAGEQSHWGMWAASDEERRVAVQPDIEMLCWALDGLVLHRKLQDVPQFRTTAGDYSVWFDFSAAAVRSNQQEDARQAHDRALIGDRGARRLSGIAETDAPTPDEIIRAVGRAIKNPMLALHNIEGADELDWDTILKAPAKTGPAPDSPAENPETGPGEGDPGSPDDRETDVPRTQRPA